MDRAETGMKMFAGLQICANLHIYKFAIFKRAVGIPQIASFSTTIKATVIFYVEHPTELSCTKNKTFQPSQQEIK